jgi:hypothetical protein
MDVCRVDGLWDSLVVWVDDPVWLDHSHGMLICS